MLFGCFAGLCTLFSLAVTIGVGWQEHLHSNWPETIATIEQCNVNSTGQELEYYVINCRISYTVGDRKVTSQVHSQSTRAPEKIIWEYPPGQTQRMFGKMQEWVAAHPPGTSISAHYDPSSYERAALVVTDMPLGGPQTQWNVKFTKILATICLALLAIGTAVRRLSVRRSR